MLSYPLRSGIDLTGLPGTSGSMTNSTIADCVVQDVDPGGNVLWQWDALNHLDPVHEPASPINPVTVNGQSVYDVFHCNSADAGPNGDVLVSLRHTNAIYDVRRSDGKVQWKLGGTSSDPDGAELITAPGDPDGGFVMQHDARFLPNGNVTLFDNQNALTGYPARARAVAEPPHAHRVDRLVVRHADRRRELLHGRRPRAARR